MISGRHIQEKEGPNKHKRTRRFRSMLGRREVGERFFKRKAKLQIETSYRGRTEYVLTGGRAHGFVEAPALTIVANLRRTVRVLSYPESVKMRVKEAIIRFADQIGTRIVRTSGKSQASGLRCCNSDRVPTKSVQLMGRQIQNRRPKYPDDFVHTLAGGG